MGWTERKSSSTVDKQPGGIVVNLLGSGQRIQQKYLLCYFAVLRGKDEVKPICKPAQQPLKTFFHSHFQPVVLACHIREFWDEFPGRKKQTKETLILPARVAKDVQRSLTANESSWRNLNKSSETETVISASQTAVH